MNKSSSQSILQKILSQATGLLIWAFSINIPLYAQILSPTPKTSPTATSPTATSSTTANPNWLKDNIFLVTLVAGVIGGIISGLFAIFTTKQFLDTTNRLIQLKDQQFSNLEDEKAAKSLSLRIENLNSQIGLLKAQLEFAEQDDTNPVFKKLEELLKIKEPLESLLEWFSEEINKQKIELGKATSQPDAIQINTHLSEIEAQAAKLQNSLEPLSNISKKFLAYRTVEEWLTDEIAQGLVEKAANHALNKYPDFKYSTNAVESLCKSLEKYVGWICVSIKALGPIAVRKDKLEPVVPFEVYKASFDYIKDKASNDISKEKAAELSNFIDHLLNKIFNTN